MLRYILRTILILNIPCSAPLVKQYNMPNTASPSENVKFIASEVALGGVCLLCRYVVENHLACMEPLCTISKHRKKGLAAATLSEHYGRLRPLGATHMTGGGNTFYEKIGFKPLVHRTFLEKNCLKKYNPTERQSSAFLRQNALHTASSLGNAFFSLLSANLDLSLSGINQSLTHSKNNIIGKMNIADIDNMIYTIVS